MRRGDGAIAAAVLAHGASGVLVTCARPHMLFLKQDSSWKHRTWGSGCCIYWPTASGSPGPHDRLLPRSFCATLYLSLPLLSVAGGEGLSVSSSGEIKTQGADPNPQRSNGEIT